jgi:hypothetical protein
MDDRGLAAGIMRFILVGGLFALMYGVLDRFISDLIDGGLGLPANSGQVATLQGYMTSAWVALPAIVVFILSIRLVARAVFESRGGA